MRFFSKIFKKKKKHESALDQVLQTLGEIYKEEKYHGDGVDKALEKVFNRQIKKEPADKSKQQKGGEVVKELNVRKGFAWESDGIILCDECWEAETLRILKMGGSSTVFIKKDPLSIAEMERYCSKCGARIERE